MKREEKTTLLTRRYDLTGNGILRIFQHQVTAKCIPLGNYKGGAGFKCIAVFTLLHYLGSPIFYILIRFERQMSSLYRFVKRLSGRGRQKAATAEDRGS